MELAGEGVEGFFEGGGVDGEVGREREDGEVIHASHLRGGGKVPSGGDFDPNTRRNGGRLGDGIAELFEASNVDCDAFAN